MPKRLPQAGFTLIELLIVVTLSVMLMLAASALFMTFLISNTKTTSGQLIKNEGEYALNQMEFLLRNAIQLVPNAANQTCTTNMSTIRFKSLDGGITTLGMVSDTSESPSKNKIASTSAVTSQNLFLTSSGIELVSGPTFNCSTTSDKLSNYVQITFTLRKGVPGVDQARDIVTQTFTTGVSLRTY